MFRTGAQMSILVLLTGLFLLWVSQFWPVKAVDEAFAARLGQVEGWSRRLATSRGWFKEAPGTPVVLVAINDNSVASHAWPWTPLDFSLFIQAITPFQPDLIAINEVLDWDQADLAPGDHQKLPQYEKILHDALLRSPRVLLAAELGWPEDPALPPPVREAPILRHIQGDVRAVPEWTVFAHEPKEDFRLSSSVGFVNLTTSGHPIRSIPLLLRYQGRVVPSLVLQAVLLWEKLSLDDVTVVLGSHLALGDKLRVPIDERGEMLVNFGAPLLQVGFDELLLATEQKAAHQRTVIPVERLKLAVTLLARTDRAAEHFDLGAGQSATRGEIFAAAIATIQSGAFLRPAPLWLHGAILALATLVAGGAPLWKKGRVALGALGTVAVYLVIAAVLYHTQHLLLPLALPLGLAAFMALYRLATPNNVWKLRRPVIL